MKNEESILKELEPIYTPEDWDRERKEEIRHLNHVLFSSILHPLAHIFFFISDVFDDIGYFFY